MDLLMALTSLIGKNSLEQDFSSLLPPTFESAVDQRWERVQKNQPLGKELEVEKTIHNTVDYLLRTQAKEGYWVGELEANASITCEWMMLMYYMGLVNPEKQRKAANYLLQIQNENGSWSIYSDNPGDLSTTVEAYFCLKMAGHSPDESPLKKAREYILSHGGMLQCRMMTRIWLSFFGQYERRALPNMPTEFIFAPNFFTFNINNICSWARTIIVPLLVIFAMKPYKAIPDSMKLDELYPIPKEKLKYSFGKAERFFSWKNFFLWSDKFLKLTENNLQKILRPFALKKAEKWILDHQIETGDCAGIFPAMANTVLALHLLGHPMDFPPIQKGLQALERFQIEEGDTLRQQSCVSPVWDTAWVVYALHTCGYSYHHESVQKSMDWLFANQIKIKGDWAIKNRNTPPGGWAFQFHNDLNPDTDDSAVVLMALLGDNLKDPQKRQEFRRGLNWLLSMQNEDGGWGAFEIDNAYYILNEFPFSESDNLVDPSTSDVTGRVLEAAGQMGMDRHHPAIQRGIAFLKKEQEPFGGWYGRWGVNYIYGTWSVLCALRSVGEDMKSPYIQKAIQWLKSIQNEDGGWGESCKSYVDKTWIGKGSSCASQTAWAMMALIAAGEEKSENVERGVQFLLDRQKSDGTWDEPEFTGTGFPQFFLIRYHMYRIYFPLLALARYRQAIQ